MSAQAQPLLTVEQYLELDRAAETRHEYYKGRMYAMSGGTFRHAQINGNLSGELRAALKGRGCSVLPADMRTAAAGIYAYPDIVVVCGGAIFHDGRKDVLLNPTILVEVLSASTEGYDRGLKSAHYRKIESLQEYAIVSQIEPRIEIFRRQQNGQWMLAEFIGLDAICRFETLNCEIRLSEIYDGDPFDAEEQARALIPPFA
jgi:Uma2 family endonuclease